MFEASLKAKKNIVDMKPNTFLSLWNNPGFAIQFEKFLSAPAETSNDAKLYRQRMNKILALLSAGNATKANQDEAFNLLPKASEFESDANNCATIHEAVYAAANARVEIQRLTEADQSLQKQLGAAQYNNLKNAQSLAIATEAVDKSDQASYTANQQEVRLATMDPSKKDIASIEQTIQRNQAQIATAGLQAKFALQSLILQFFVQRRYQHVIIIDRFYRALFDDGDQSLEGFQQMADKLGYNKAAGQLKLVADAAPTGSAAAGSSSNGGASAGAGTNGTGASVGNNGKNNGGDGSALSGSGVHLGVENLSVESMENAFTTGMQGASRTFKSLSQLDAFANEIIRDVNEGVNVYRFLLEKKELESASSQLAAVFMKGEYLPSVRLLTVEEKRKTLEYAQLCNRLVNAANSGNIDALSEVVVGMKKLNPSFDDAEILAKLQGVKTASSLLVAQAKVAAAKGNLQAVQTEIIWAVALWPNNPEVMSFSSDMSKLSEKAAPQVQAINDFDRLYERKNFRQIFEEKEKYIAAISQSPERQGKLSEVLSQMQTIEAALMRSQEIARSGNYAGAWEVLEIARAKYSDDPKLNQMRADLTTQAPDFVHDLREAQSREEKKEYGSALAWYLRTQKSYPGSDLSRLGVMRVIKQAFPDAS
jgi:hypothetical protein